MPSYMVVTDTCSEEAGHFSFDMYRGVYEFSSGWWVHGDGSCSGATHENINK